MIAVRPPEYFPRLEYLAVLQHVDHFILADTFPYRRQSFQDRSKLRNAPGWHWISVPTIGQREGAPLREVEIKTEGRWQEKHWRSFLYDYRSTMYFEYFQADFQPFFDSTWTYLGPCACRSVELSAELFGLRTKITRTSALAGTPTDLAGVLEAVAPDTVAIPASQGDLGDWGSSVEVTAVTYEPPTYRQNFEGFEPGMAAVDLVFNYGREAPRLLAKGLQASEATPRPMNVREG